MCGQQGLLSGKAQAVGIGLKPLQQAQVAEKPQGLHRMHL